MIALIAETIMKISRGSTWFLASRYDFSTGCQFHIWARGPRSQVFKFEAHKYINPVQPRRAACLHVSKAMAGRPPALKQDLVDHIANILANTPEGPRLLRDFGRTISAHKKRDYHLAAQGLLTLGVELFQVSLRRLQGLDST